MSSDHPNNRQSLDQDRGRLGAMTDRWSALPDATRKLVEGLHDDDVARLGLLVTLLREKGGTDREGRPNIDKIRQGVEMAEAASTLGRWSKWVVVTAVALFAGIAGLLASLNQLAAWFKGPGAHP